MHRLFLLALLCTAFLRAQPSETDNLELSVFRGNILKHTPYVGHLMAGHPRGFVLSWNRQTFGEKEWQRAFNYPDYGVSLLYQDNQNPVLGDVWAVGAHYNFYFFKRHLSFRISQGIAMATNPYDKETNYKNNAFGSKFMSANTFMLSYKKADIIDRFGVQAGFIFTHFSNGRIKSPNSGINAYLFQVGVNYDLQEKNEYLTDTVAPARIAEPIKFNGVVRSGVSESQIAGSGQKPFYHIGLYADKRLSRKSAVQLGVDVFVSEYLKEYIRYRAVAYPEFGAVDPDTDYKRVAVVAGHELFINRLSVETQLGLYVYKPFKYESDLYQRVGVKYYLTDKIFAALSLKAHGGRAEAIETGIGVRL
jgi:hypothetical protein